MNNGLMTATGNGTLEVLDAAVTGSSGRYVADDGTIRVVCSNPFLRTPRGAATDVSGLSLEATNGGTVEVDGPVEINLTGTVTFDSGGTYQGAPSSNGVLRAGDMTINSTGNGGGVRLTSLMAFEVGDITIGGCGAFLRGCTPPVLGIADNSSADVNGTLTIEGDVDLTVDSSQPVLLAGDFNNRCMNPSLFDWDAGDLTLDGSTPQTFELAGFDYGPRNPAGFVDNFAMGTLRIEPGRTVDFLNAFDNVDGPGCEALYVQTLSLGAGSTVRLHGCYVYYDTLVKESGVNVQPQGGGLMSIHAGDLNNDGNADLTDAAALANYLVGNACLPPVICQARADINGDGVANGLDIEFMIRLLITW